MNATRDFDESLVMLAGARVISTAKDQFDRAVPYPRNGANPL